MVAAKSGPGRPHCTSSALSTMAASATSEHSCPRLLPGFRPVEGSNTCFRPDTGFLSGATHSHHCYLPFTFGARLFPSFLFLPFFESISASLKVLVSLNQEGGVEAPTSRSSLPTCTPPVCQGSACGCAPVHENDVEHKGASNRATSSSSRSPRPLVSSGASAVG